MHVIAVSTAICLLTKHIITKGCRYAVMTQSWSTHVALLTVQVIGPAEAARWLTDTAPSQQLRYSFVHCSQLNRMSQQEQHGILAGTGTVHRASPYTCLSLLLIASADMVCDSASMSRPLHHAVSQEC